MNLNEAIAAINRPRHADVTVEVQQRLDSLTKPPGSEEDDDED